MKQSIIKRQRRRRSRPHKLVIAALAALALLAVVPAAVAEGVEIRARATCRQAIESGTNHYGEVKEGEEWPCPLGVPEAEQAEREIKAAKEDAEAEANALAVRTKALSEPVTHLSVKAVAHATNCHPLACAAAREPGYTTLEVTTAPFAYVTIRLVRYGDRTEHYELGPGSTHVTVKVPWSCSSPGGAYHYSVMAHSNVGPTLTRRGAFRPPSTARCHELKRGEAEARAQSERAYREGLAREREAERARLKQWEGNCRALGDTPVLLHEEGSTVHVCRTPEGYTIEVPE